MTDLAKRQNEGLDDLTDCVQLFCRAWFILSIVFILGPPVAVRLPLPRKIIFPFRPWLKNCSGSSAIRGFRELAVGRDAFKVVAGERFFSRFLDRPIRPLLERKAS